MQVRLELDSAKLVEALSDSVIEDMAIKAGQPLYGLWEMHGDPVVDSIGNGRVCLTVTIEPDDIDDDDEDDDWYDGDENDEYDEDED